MSFLLIDNLFKFLKSLNKIDSNLENSLYSDNFHCFCKKNIDLEESALRKHIQNCKHYQKESPFYKEFLSLPLKLFKKVHLLALKSEFINFIDMIDEQLQKPLKGSPSQIKSSPLPSSPKTIQNNQLIKQSLFRSPMDKATNICVYCCKNYVGVCENSACKLKMRISCNVVLECGHQCCGVVDDPNCPPCMVCDLQVDLQDLCSICYVETLAQAPCIITKCGHIFHYNCVMRCLQLKWSSPDITFSFCTCALCKTWLEFDAFSQPQQIIDGFLRLKQELQHKALKHFRQTQKDIDGKNMQVLNPGELALSLYCYYLCSLCRIPYFGGSKDCQRLADSSQLRAEDLICPNCAHSERCAKHGTEFIEYKCRYCCQLSLYFCWGTTHFCEDCHHKQSNGEYLNQKARDELPQCGELCAIGGQHRPNGEEQALGCSFTHNIKFYINKVFARNESSTRSSQHNYPIRVVF